MGSIALYRKKPVEIEAVQWLGPPTPDDPERITVDELQTWGANVEPDGSWSADYALIIPTLEGRMRADVGDWIIRGVKGEFYPCKPDVFEASYDYVPSTLDEDGDDDGAV